MTWPHTTSRVYLGLFIVLGLVLAGPDLFRIWASLSLKARPYRAGCVWTPPQKKDPVSLPLESGRVSLRP